MAGDSLKFRSDNSVLSKINGTPYPTISQDLTNITSDINNNTNSEVTANQNNLSTKEGQNLNKVNSVNNPAKGSDSLSIDSLKDKSKVKLNSPELASIQEQNVDAKSDEEGNVISNIYNSGKHKVNDWLKARKQEAIDNITGYASESLNDVTTPESTERPNSEENTRVTPKSNMGRVPALDAEKPSPEVPDINGEREVPRPKMSPQSRLNSMPNMNMPKIAIPKIKFR